METRRLILATTLSIMVYMGYLMFFTPKQAVKTYKPDKINKKINDVKNNNVNNSVNNDVKNEQEQQKIQNNKKDIAKQTHIEKTNLSDNTKGVISVAEKKELVKVDTELFTAIFTNKGAALKSFVLKKYKDDDEKQKNLLDLVSKKINTEQDELLPFHFSTFDQRNINNELYEDANKTFYKYEKKEDRNKIILEFKFIKNKVQVSKTFTINKGTYVIGLDSKIVKEGKRIAAPYIFGPELGNNLRQSSSIYEAKGFDGANVEKTSFKSMKSGYVNFGKTNGYNFNWGAFDTTYFTIAFKFDVKDRNSRISTFVSEIVAKDGKKIRKAYLIATNSKMVFMGPKEERILEKSGKDFGFIEINQVISYGYSWFTPIAKLILKGINFIHEKVLNHGNYGWAIVIFTIFLKLLLFPLTYKSSVSMAKMQTIQPKMKALKKKYKNQKDPAQRKAMNEELMALYKTEKVNPAGGCLPMLLQMPILFAFFTLLRNAINVRHEVWILWIKDLSMLDPYYVLPILMGLTQIILAKMSPASGDANQKKMMTYMMPVVITFFVMRLASGLTLYWFVSNLLQLGQQHYINKKIYQEKKDTDKQMRAAKKKKGVKKL